MPESDLFNEINLSTDVPKTKEMGPNESTPKMMDGILDNIDDRTNKLKQRHENIVESASRAWIADTMSTR